MADLNKVRVQVLDPTTGSVIENVDVKTSDGAVYLPDGTTLRNWIANSEEARAYIQKIVVEHLTTQHVDADKVDSVITAVDFDANTGIFTFTKHDGSTKEVDTTLEKLPIAFDCINGAGIDGYTADDILLEITLDDNTKKYVRLSDLIDIYTGGDTSEISVNVDESNNNITATLVNGGITNDKIADGTITRGKIDSAFEAQIASLETAIGSGGSVDSKIADAVNALDSTVTNYVPANVETGTEEVVPDVRVDITQEDGKLTGVSATVKPNTFDAYGAASAVQGSTTETVASVDAKVTALQTSSEVTVEKLAVATEGYISSYVVKQNGTQVGETINIPKDYLVKSADLKEATDNITGSDGSTVIVEAGHRYIDFVVNTVGDDGNESHIYLDVNTLIDVYTGGATSEISVDIDSATNEVTATLVDGGITNSKIAVGTIARDKIDSAFETQIADIEGILDVDTNRGKTINTIVTDGINSVLGGSTETVDSLNTKIENKITKDDVTVDVNLDSDDNTTVLSVSGLENPTLYTKVGTAVPEQGISVAVNSPSGVTATINYQWYYKNVGTDSDFVTLTGATTATLPSASIPVDVAATTIYYCVVTATGENVNATPVASKKLTVVVV